MVKLEDYNHKELKGIAKKYNKTVNLTGYSKLGKNDLIKLIRNHESLKVVENERGVKINIPFLYD